MNPAAAAAEPLVDAAIPADAHLVGDDRRHGSGGQLGSRGDRRHADRAAHDPDHDVLGCRWPRPRPAGRPGGGARRDLDRVVGRVLDRAGPSASDRHDRFGGARPHSARRARPHRGRGRRRRRRVRDRPPGRLGGAPRRRRRRGARPTARRHRHLDRRQPAGAGRGIEPALPDQPARHRRQRPRRVPRHRRRADAPPLPAEPTHRDDHRRARRRHRPDRPPAHRSLARRCRIVEAPGRRDGHGRGMGGRPQPRRRDRRHRGGHGHRRVDRSRRAATCLRARDRTGPHPRSGRRCGRAVGPAGPRPGPRRHRAGRRSGARRPPGHPGLDRRDSPPRASCSSWST